MKEKQRARTLYFVKPDAGKHSALWYIRNSTEAPDAAESKVDETTVTRTTNMILD